MNDYSGLFTLVAFQVLRDNDPLLARPNDLELERAGTPATRPQQATLLQRCRDGTGRLRRSRPVATAAGWMKSLAHRPERPQANEPVFEPNLASPQHPACPAS